MESYLIYIGKSGLAAGVFFLAYLMLFQNKKHFVFNRIYLPATLLLSFLIPLITFTVVEYVEVPKASFNSYVRLDNSFEGTIPAGTYSWWPHYLFLIYWPGVAVFLFFLVTGHVKAIQIIRRSRNKNLFGYKVHITEKDVHPFSFFNKIIISERTLGSRNLRMIVEHEKIHVQEMHTLDILFVEILFVLQWFNPFAWLLREAVKANLEYKTDDEIIRHHNPVAYQLAMVAQADKKGVAPFLTALNGGQLKDRIIMMKKNPCNRFALLKKLVVLPLLALIVMGLSEREVRTEFIQQQEVIAQKEPAGLLQTLVSPGIITDQEGNYRMMMDSQQKTLLFVHEGYEPLEIISGSGRQIDVQLKTTVSNSTPSDTVQSETNAEMIPDIKQVLSGNEPLYVVDGKITKLINQVPPQDIESIDVLKGPSAIANYGTMGKNGVVLITTKSKSYDYLNEDARIVRPQPQDQIPLPEEWPQFPGGEEALRQYIANNIRYPESARENGIQGKAYVSFRITREGKVTDVRLTRGVHPPLDQEALRVVNNMPDWKPATKNGQVADSPLITVPVNFVIKDPVVKVISYANSPVIPGPLYIVDGIATTSIKNIDPDDIKHIDVLNSETSTALYGQRGKDGVIIISTKQGSAVNKIITERQLRQFVAEKIKYPAEAQSKGLQGTTSVVIEPGSANRIVTSQNVSREDVHNLDAVVVVGYGGDAVQLSEPEKDLPSMLREVERVLQMLPGVDIPTIEKKLIKINVEFKLQAE